jgi:hypothetical protein
MLQKRGQANHTMRGAFRLVGAGKCVPREAREPRLRRHRNSATWEQLPVVWGFVKKRAV